MFLCCDTRRKNNWIKGCCHWRNPCQGVAMAIIFWPCKKNTHRTRVREPRWTEKDWPRSEGTSHHRPTSLIVTPLYNDSLSVWDNSDINPDPKAHHTTVPRVLLSHYHEMMKHGLVLVSTYGMDGVWRLYLGTSIICGIVQANRGWWYKPPSLGLKRTWGDW